MQYTLTQEEFDNLRYRREAAEQERRDQLQRLCSLVADHMPVTVDWMPEPVVWGCILTRKDRSGYCDCCPVQEDCPYNGKAYSK